MLLDLSEIVMRSGMRSTVDVDQETLEDPDLRLAEPLLRQQVLTEVPIRTLCASACRGLCPYCGADLNQGPCACPTEPPETPFSKLATLLGDGDGGGTNPAP